MELSAEELEAKRQRKLQVCGMSLCLDGNFTFLVESSFEGTFEEFGTFSSELSVVLLSLICFAGATNAVWRR